MFYCFVNEGRKIRLVMKPLPQRLQDRLTKTLEAYLLVMFSVFGNFNPDADAPSCEYSSMVFVSYLFSVLMIAEPLH